MSAEYERLQDRVDRRRKTIMDAYGATHPAEFFAVASECFFEKPAQLQKHRPSLYQQLKQFYGQDPVLYDAGESWWNNIFIGSVRGECVSFNWRGPFETFNKI